MTLQEIYNKYKVGDWPDKGSTHSYIHIYENLLDMFRFTAANVLEIGLMSGESLRMWTEYFNHDQYRTEPCNVYGMDCSETPIDGLADLRPIIGEGKYRVCIGDAANPSDIKKFFNGIKFQVVIEDAMHNISQQLQIYNALKPYMDDESIYIIEDIENIDETRELFENIDPTKEVWILDRRHVKNRFDDCLVVITHKRKP